MTTHQLCDFAVTEMIHDFGSSIEGTDPGPQSTNVIQAGRYKKDKILFDRLLSSGLPNNKCKTYTKYDEPGILKLITNNAKIKEMLKSKQLAGKEITTINGKVFRITIADRKTLSENNGGAELYDQFEFNTDKPVVLADTFTWVFKTLKLGDWSPDKEMIIYNPLVVRADSASKVNITDKNDMKKYFANQTGINLINVVDRNDFTCQSFVNNYPDVRFGAEDSYGFFSKYTIKTFFNKNEQLEQIWSGLSNQGQKDNNIIRCPADKINNKTNTFNRMTLWINSQTKTSDPKRKEIENHGALSNLVQDNPVSRKNQELFNVELQSKRSGDWLPVLFILNYESYRENCDKKKIITYSNPNEKEDFDPDTYNEYFVKNNMYILTIDTPLVAYSLYSGVNVLYITADNTIVNFTYMREQ
jgi:hypothetical protein